jgi:hypothetical protein
VENTFENESQSARPSSCQYFSTGLSIPSGKFIFLKHGRNNLSKETVEFAYNKFSLSLSKSEDDSSMELSLKLQSINLDINDFQDKDIRTINVLKSVELDKEKK